MSPCVPLRCTNHKKNGSKTRYSGDKTELRKEHRRFCQNAQAAAVASARAIAGFPAQERSRGTPSVPKSDACDARELWCFALVSSSSCLQRREPRVAADVSAPSTFLWDAVGAFNFGARARVRPAQQTHQSGRSCRAAIVSARHAGRVGHLYPSSHCRRARDEIQLSWRFQSTNNAKARSYTRSRGEKRTGCCAPPCASTSPQD